MEKSGHGLGLRKIVCGMGFVKKEKEKAEVHFQPPSQHQILPRVEAPVQASVVYVQAPVQPLYQYQVPPLRVETPTQVPVVYPQASVQTQYRYQSPPRTEASSQPPAPPLPPPPDLEQRHEQRQKRDAGESSNSVMTSEDFAEGYRGLIGPSPWEEDGAPEVNCI